MEISRTQNFIRKIVLVVFMVSCLFSTALHAQIACSNSVQISMDEHCQVSVTAEMILEGKHDDYGVYIVEIDGQASNIINQPGEYGITIRDSRNNNSCWSKIKVEDKLGPQMHCGSITLPCASVGRPGDPIIERYITEGHVIKTTQDSLYIAFNFNPQIPYDALVKDVSMDLYMEHNDISEMQAYLVSPYGKRMMLFDKPQSSDPSKDCLKKDMLVYINDYADKGHHMMTKEEECREHATPSMHGEYKPHDPFSVMYGEVASGNWKLIIADVNRNEHKSALKYCKLRMTVGHGHIGLPFSGHDMHIEHLGDKHMMFTGGDLCSDMEARYSDVYDKNCFENGEHYGMMQRSWSVTDHSGNTSTCVQPIYFNATSFDHYDMPYDYDGFYFPSFTCHTDFHGIFDEHGMPSPEVTGKPTDRRHAGNLVCGNIQVNYKDVKLDICEGSYKVLRTWTLINWCDASNSNIKEHTQVIELKDKVPPVVVCPAEQDRIINIHNPHQCTTDLFVPPPHIKYECSDYDWTVQFHQSELYDECEEPSDNYYSSKGVIVKDGHVTIEGIGLGCIWIKYIVTDKCGNTTTETCLFKLLDKAPPVPICEEETVVSLGTDGVAKVFAQTFDDLSWDNCSEIATYKVRKIDGLCDTIYEPMDYVTFCCAEIGSKVMVELTVADHYGNKNSCIVQATIQDKVNPYLNCPDSVIVNCLTPLSALSDEKYGSPIGNDNCGGAAISDVLYTDSLNQCRMGYVYKTWMLEEAVVGEKKEVCTQVFKFVHHDSIGYHEVYFPNDTLLQGCAVNADVAITGEPKIHESGCGLIAVSSEDTRFSFVDDACEKIIREWTVIDWCRYKPEAQKREGYWVNSQIIKIQNPEAPSFSGACDDIFVCSYSPICLGEITLGVSASDDCSSIDELQWEYAIDLFGDGSIDMKSSAVTFRNDSVFVSLDSIPLDAQHQIVWTVSDGCNNYKRCNYGFTVEDCKAPTPYCISDIVTTVMQQTGEAVIWAKDFDLKSEDNCTDYNDLKFSFSQDTSFTSRQFTCSDIDNGISQRVNLDMWLTDEHGNQERCKVIIELQDNVDVCQDREGGGLKMDIEGQVTNEADIPLSEVQITVKSNQAGYPQTINTGDDGGFNFNSLNPDMAYEFSSSRNIDFLNGISTLDIVLIQQHIIGEQVFDNPYKVIAADVDNNQSVSVSDLIILRQLILGAIPNFPNGQESWRFIDKNAGFFNPETPFPFVESININNTSSLSSINFMGIKIGDVNGSAVADIEQDSETRSFEDFTIHTKDVKLVAGQNVSVTFINTNDLNIHGMQQSLQFDPLAVSIHSVHSSTLNLNQSHYRKTADGVHLSWSQQDGVELSEGSLMYVIELEVHKSGHLSDFISVDLDQNSLTSEVYDGAFETYQLHIDYINELDEPFKLYQNTPNPFEQQSKIGFQLKKSSIAQLHIYDLSGKLVYELSDEFSSGFNELTVDKHKLGESGIYYYTLTVNGVSATKKMILLE